MAVAVLVSALSAYLTHLLWVLRVSMMVHATAEQILVAVFGTIFVPLGMVHGYMLWLGYMV